MYRVTRLQNSLTVVTAEMPHMASVSLGLWVGVGGRFEPAPWSGVSHFIEHMLFKGTRRRTSREISQAIEGIGGYLNGFTGEENTCFYAKARHDHLPELFEVLMDMMLNSTFDPAEIDKERGVIKEELASYLDQPSQHVHELLDETMWPDHPLGRSLTGTEQTLDRLGRAEMVQFHRQNYVAPATLLAAAGRVSHDKLVRLVQRSASRFGPGACPVFQPFSARFSQPRVRLETKDTAQTQLALGLQVCSRHHADRFALRLLNAMLGENMSSRLFQVLREDTGLAYSVHSSVNFFDDVGALTVAAGVDPDKVHQALRLVIAELRRFADKAPTASEVQQARDYLIGQIDLALENTESQMMWVGEHWLGYGELVTAAQVKRSLSRVTAAEVRAAARAYFRPDALSLAVISPQKKLSGLASLLSL